jgi:hypothetical protein
VLALRGDLAGDSLSEEEAAAVLRAAPGSGETVPEGAARFPPHGGDEEELGAAPLRVRPEEPRRDHLRVVQDEDVPFTKEGRKVRDAPVRDGSGAAVERHEARGAARGGALRDRRGREVEVEEGHVHAPILNERHP